MLFGSVATLWQDWGWLPMLGVVIVLVWLAFKKDRRQRKEQISAAEARGEARAGASVAVDLGGVHVLAGDYGTLQRYDGRRAESGVQSEPDDYRRALDTGPGSAGSDRALDGSSRVQGVTAIAPAPVCNCGARLRGDGGHHPACAELAGMSPLRRAFKTAYGDGNDYP